MSEHFRTAAWALVLGLSFAATPAVTAPAGDRENRPSRRQTERPVARDTAVRVLTAVEDGRAAEPGGLVEQPAVKIVPATQGEDGVPFAASRSDRSESPIHPDLTAAMISAENVEVFLYLRSAPGGSGMNPFEVKQQHMPGIRELSERIREIELKYRPGGSLTPAAENGLLHIESNISQEDHAERLELQEESDRRLDAMRWAVTDAMAETSQATQDSVSMLVHQLGGEVRLRIVTGNVLDAIVPGTALEELAAHPLVGSIAPRLKGRPALSETPGITGFGTWYTNGFTGGVYDAGVMDTGVQQDHPAFAGVNFYTNTGGSVDPDGHGTHVAGIIASKDSLISGTAYGLDSLIWGNDFYGVMDWAASSSPQTPEVFNMSWSWGPSSNDYEETDRWFDVYVDFYDILIAFAAGNEGWDNASSKLVRPARGYNSIMVANMDSWGNTDRSDDVRSGDSSTGPTPAGRRKPDISAPGHRIRSLNAFWTGGGLVGGWCAPTEPNDFCQLSGTSMASPHVAGAALLLHEGGVWDSMAVRAILINTADWWTSEDTQDTADDGPVGIPTGTATQWDMSYGWGYLNMHRAFVHRTDYVLDSVVPRNDNAIEDDYRLYRGFLNAGESVTLAWKRRGLRGPTWPDGLDSSVYDLTDLNMKMFSATNGTLLDSDLATLDTVHQVHAVSDQEVVVKVYAWSTSIDSAASEDFALATEEGFYEVDFPDEFSGVASWPAEVEPNEEFDVTFWVHNNSTVASFNNNFDLTLPAGFVLVSGPDIQTGGVAPSGDISGLASWTLRAPGTPSGAATISVLHTHNSYDESYGPFSWDMSTTVQWDVVAPNPDPLTWAVLPDDTGQSSIQMTVTTATDPHEVQYYFDFTSSPTGGAGANDGGWNFPTTFGDFSLGSNHQYCYRAYARDLSSGLNTTGFTTTQCAYTEIQPALSPSFPTVTTNSIAVQSSNTPPGLTRGLSGLKIYNDTLGTDTGWDQHNNPQSWIFLPPNTPYTFRTQSRNGDGDPTAPSSPQTVYTLAVPPIPGALVPLDPMSISVSVDPADDNPAGTEYRFQNLQTLEFSPWSSSTTWINTGLSCGELYSYRAQARNGDGVETIWPFLGITGTSVDADADTDGFAPCQGDCNDTNPLVHPGAVEVCDGIDNNCNGLSDELFVDTDLDQMADCVDPDDDNDGTLDASDCRSLDSTVWATPLATESLTLSHTDGPGGTTTLNWTPPAVPGTIRALSYDLVVTDDPTTWDGSNPICYESDDTDTTATHTFTPPPGVSLFFLPRAQSGCGMGSPGSGIQYPQTPLPRNSRVCGLSHLMCETGIALDPTQDSCVNIICAADPYCCNTEWDAVCVSEVTSVCTLSCP